MDNTQNLAQVKAAITAAIYLFIHVSQPIHGTRGYSRLYVIMHRRLKNIGSKQTNIRRYDSSQTTDQLLVLCFKQVLAELRPEACIIFLLQIARQRVKGSSTRVHEAPPP